MARPRAAPALVPRAGGDRLHRSVGICIIVKRIERRLGTFLGELYGGQHRFFRPFVEQIELFVRQFSLTRELRAQTRDRIVEPIFLQFLLGPVTCRVRHRVAAITIGAHFQECRMRFLSDGIYNLGDLVADFAKVHSIDDFSGNVVTFRAIDDLPERGRSLHGSTHCEKVVFTNEDDRQFIESRQIQRFVEGSLIDRSITEKAERDAIFAPVLDGESQSHRQRNVSCDNGVTSVHVMLLVEKMHRATQAARTACFFSKKLRHTGVRACAASKRVSVIAVSGDDVVIVANGRDGAGHNCFLANVKVTKTADLLRLILLTGAFLETPNQQHQREHLDFVALLHRLHDGLSRARNRGSGARALRASAKVHGKNKEQGETRDR